MKRHRLAAICIFASGTIWGAGAQGAPSATGQSDSQAAATASSVENAPANEAATPAASSRNVTFGQRFSFDGSVELAEIYNSNAFGTGAPSSSAFFGTSTPTRSTFATEARLNLNLHDRTPRFQADISYSLVGDFYPQYSSLNSFQNYLNGLANAEIVPETLFLHATAFATPTFLTRLGILYPTPGVASTLNSQNSYGYVLTPYLVNRFGDIARSNFSVSRAEVAFGELGGTSVGPAPPFGSPANTVSNSISEQLTSLTFFNRFQWAILATAQETAQGGFHFTERLASADMNYAVTRQFTILSTVGYEKFKSSPMLTRDLSGLILLGGFHYAPSQAFQLTVKAGRQFNFPSYFGDLQYQITATSAFLLSVSDTVTTPQQRLLGGLNGIGTTPLGSFFPINSQLPDQSLLPNLPPPSPGVISPLPLDGLPLDNSFSRYRTAYASLLHTMPRTSYSVRFYGTVQDYLSATTLPINTRQTVIGTTISASHSLRPDLSATISADYSAAREFNQLDKLFGLSGSLNYTISPVWSTYLSASYLNRTAGASLFVSTNNASDVIIAVGVRRSF
jgi:uncharacterized protein (PEP-CTERM system associated)